VRSTKGFQNFINLEKKEDDYAKKLGEIIVENDVDLQSKEDDIPKLLNQLSKFNKNTNNAIENIQSLFDTLRKIEKLISDFRLSQFVSNTTNKEENGYYTCNKFIEFVKTLLNPKLDTAALITFDTEDIIPIAESNFNKDEKGEQYNIKFKDQKYKKYKVFYNTLAKFLSVAKDVQNTYKEDIQDTINQINQSRKELQDIQNKINQGKAKKWEIEKKNKNKKKIKKNLKKKKKKYKK